MSYSAPANLLQTAAEAALAAMTDADGNPLLRGALISPIPIPMECGRPYALIDAGIQTNRDGDAETTCYVSVHVDALLTREGYLAAHELAWEISTRLYELLAHGELADGIHAGSVRLIDFALQLVRASEDASPTPEAYVFTIELRPEWLD